MQKENTTLKQIWWIKPNTLIGFGIIPAYTVIGAITGTIETTEYWLAFLLILSLYSGCQLISSLTPSPKLESFSSFKFSQKTAEQLLSLFFALSLTGYIAWFGEVIINPKLILSALSLSQGQIFTIRGIVETTPGISTLAQFGIAYSALYAKLLTCNTIKNKNKYLCFFIIIILLTSMRSWLWSERLAIIEIICPFAITYIVHINTSKSTARILRLFPIVALTLVYSIFSIFEYFRSWRHYSETHDNFFSFTLERFINYYSSSVENGVGFLQWQDSPSYDGTFLLTFIHRLPYIGELLRTGVDAGKSFHSYLYCCANPEFNLASWPFLISSDIGVPLSLLFFFAIGLLFGMAYNGFTKSKPSFIYYPVIYVSILELLRQHYIHNPRLTYVLIGAIIVNILMKRKKNKTIPNLN